MQGIHKTILCLLFRRPLLVLLFTAAQLSGHGQEKTSVTITIPQNPAPVDPMIYGQMLENVNDSMIYGGVTDMQGNEQKQVIPLLKDLQVPVLRWPGGTVVYEYHWRNGIGPRSLRPVVSTLAWQGKENYQFGTDEFLQWCRKIGTTPYINLNMGTHPLYGSTLREALEWIGYVNGPEDSDMGKLRAYHGHKDPYGVKYWGIGNENYLPGRAARVQDPDTVYAERLRLWASTIKAQFPDLSLLGVGHTSGWNHTVLERAGPYIDFLTQHYYVNAKVKDGRLQDPAATLFAPAKMEAHLKLLSAQLTEMNRTLQRTQHPIRLSVDEWNDRHGVYNGNSYQFSRQSVRKQFDVTVAAGMLNVFIRQSPVVGMANYIFPVNAHGLIRTVGTDDAFRTPLYYLFKQYREKMTGHKIDVTLKGPGIDAKTTPFNITGDCDEVTLPDAPLTFVDATAVLNKEGQIHIALVNRSADNTQEAIITVPSGYKAVGIWELAHRNINASNEPGKRFEVVPRTRTVKQKGTGISVRLLPCAFALLQLVAE
ncbi:hypothetical protein LL912_25055 [Niabella sp. CC-SYL272]|uniref:alpha-L-arabinofuranosidase C-terminal domain-containing protein n=1 Tax=Niabella agricola TaxID=2891571 RepID=UPI001F40F8CD|nr:alpha-L-arabinofuranosidase C-terminal domain-containing protein [Niabella agricola]MCF3112081.1 hypothetical protein [Niabella agricola]